MNKILVGIAALAVLTFAGCKTLTAPVSIAETAEQKAYALYGTFVVFEELAAAVVTDQATPENLKEAIRRFDATAKPAADSMLDATRHVITIKTQLAMGKTPNEKLEIANARLVEWVTEAQPKILALQCAVNPKQKVCEENQ